MNIEEEDKKRAIIVELLLSKGQANPNITDSRGQHTALHLCAMNGYSNVATILLRHSSKSEIDPVNKITLVTKHIIFVILISNLIFQLSIKKKNLFLSNAGGLR